MLAVRIHRGTHEVGGTCIELESAGRRLVLDAGMPLIRPRRGRELLPDVPGLFGAGDGSLEALMISHPHQDHHGLADLVERSVPIYLGARAQAVLAESTFFMPWAPSFSATRRLEHRRQIALGPFTVTPWRVDHNAEDAYAFLVEAAGSRVLYSGDWRGHGNNRWMIDELATDVGPLDTLMIEGTRIDRLDGESSALPSEDAVEDACAEVFAAARRAVLVFCSAQNLERMDRVRAACRRSGRTMVMDLYAAAMWEASGREPLREACGQIRVFLPHWQRRRIIEAQAFERLEAVRDVRIYREEILDRSSELAFVTRTSALSELENTGVLLDADAIWSMWAGYLSDSSMEPSMRILRRNGALLHFAHTSGHASADDICDLVRRLDARRVVPIHTASPAACAASFPNAELHDDGEWWAG
jgi:ribonuclease J